MVALSVADRTSIGRWLDSSTRRGAVTPTEQPMGRTARARDQSEPLKRRPGSHPAAGPALRLPHCLANRMLTRDIKASLAYGNQTTISPIRLNDWLST